MALKFENFGQYLHVDQKHMIDVVQTSEKLDHSDMIHTYHATMAKGAKVLYKYIHIYIYIYIDR